MVFSAQNSYAESGRKYAKTTWDINNYMHYVFEG